MIFGFNRFLAFTNICLWVDGSCVIWATYNQLVELGVSNQCAAIFTIKGESGGGGLPGICYTTLGEVLAGTGIIVFKGEGADVSLLSWVGKRVEMGNMSDEVPIDTLKNSYKKWGGSGGQVLPT